MAKPAGELSIAKMGRADIQLDQATKDKLKELAIRKGITLVEFMRWIADQGGDVQGKLMPSQDIELVRQQKIESYCHQAVEISRSIPMTESRRMAILVETSDLIEFEDLDHARELFQQLTTELVQYREALVTKETGQRELKLNEGLDNARSI